MDIQQLREDLAVWEILQERAHELAHHQIDTAIEQGAEVLSFRLGADGYSIPSKFIREVYPLIHWTPLPTTPSFVVGLVNVRGKILTALDVRPLLNIAQTAPEQNSFLIILSVSGTEMGLLADTVTEVKQSAPDLSPALSSVAGQGIPWVLGLDQQLNLLLDPPLLLADPRVLVYDETT
jgi:purine-binding chemotaxis protein CheW